MEKYHQSLKAIRKEMDIRLIMKKILHVEKVADALLEEHQKRVLHLQEPLTLEEAEILRKDHRFYERLERYAFLEEPTEFSHLSDSESRKHQQNQGRRL